MSGRAFTLVLLCLTTACGSGAEGGSTSTLGTCGVRADLTGGTVIHFTGEDDAACATVHSFDTGLDGLFIGNDAKGSLELIVDDVREGETDSGYPTRVVVTSPAKEHWQGTGCMTSITEHRLVQTEASEIGELRHYRVSGNGTCTEPLGSVSTASAPVTIGAFAFRAEFIWRD